MPSDEPVAVQLELDPRSNPISGRLLGCDGVTREFYGWLQFMAAVDAARDLPAVRHDPGI